MKYSNSSPNFFTKLTTGMDAASPSAQMVLLYTVVLFAATLLPFVVRMSGPFYLLAATILGAGFISYAWRLWKHYSDALARKTFRFSIWHLSLLFAALLIDHYLDPWLRTFAAP